MLRTYSAAIKSNRIKKNNVKKEDVSKRLDEFNVKKLVSFSDALVLLKKGRKIARIGWNGKDMWLILLEPELTKSSFQGYPCARYIAMKTADNKIIPWQASQADVLAEDWIEVSI